MSKLLPLPSIISRLYDKDSLVYYSDEELYYNHGVCPKVIDDITNKEFQVYAGYYEFKKGWHSPKIYLIGRGRKSGKTKIKIENFLPYCYIKSDDGEFKSLRGDNVTKILFRGPPVLVKKFRKLLTGCGYGRPYEADIPFVRRFLCDVADLFTPKNQMKLKIGIVDIETNHPVSDDIISFAINSDGCLYFNSIHLSDKIDLILDLYTRLVEHDLILGWNVGFDIEKLELELQRLKIYLKVFIDKQEIDFASCVRELVSKYNMESSEATNIISRLIEYKILKSDNNVISLNNDISFQIKKECAIIDLVPVIKKMYGRQLKGSWSLDNAGRFFCGIGKVDIHQKYPRDLSFDELLEYNVRDVVIPEILDEYFGGITCHLILSTMLQCTLEDTIITAVVNDIAILKAYHRDGIVLPSRPEWETARRETNYEAAKPLAREGKYNGIIKLDVVHSYPWAVIAVNASIETKDPQGKYCAPNGVRFNGGYSTFINELKKLMEERARVKKKLKDYQDRYGREHETTKRYKYIDFALKTQAAAFSHGIFGWENSRMRDFEVASAITSTARDLIFYAMKHADLIGYKWVYQHTDSLYLNAPSDKVDDIVSYMDDVVSNYCRNKGYRFPAKLEFKDYYDMIYVHSAGRNVLMRKNIDDVEDWEVTGMNFMRSETPDELADIEINLVKMIFRDKSDDEKLRYLRYRIKNLVNVPTSKLGLIKPLNKKIEKYGRKAKHSGEIVGVPNHIKALIRARDEYGLDVAVGDKFMVLPIVTNETVGKRKIRRKRVDIAFIPERGLPNGYIIDYETYLKSNLFGKINKMFNMSEGELYEKCKDVIPRVEV